MSSAVQVCWEKFANYWDVEPRLVPVSEQHKTFDGHDLASYVDENTIGVVAIMGVTYTGRYEPVRQIAAALDRIQEQTGLDIPIHVDAASGGFVAPFLQPGLEWDFRLDRVHSINASAHKYGLVYPGLGWVVWRGKEYLPEDLIFNVSYLGGSMPTFALNFSRPGAQVLLQYYNFLRLGREGYRSVQQASQEVASSPGRADRRDGPVRAVGGRPGDTGVRLAAQTWLHHEVGPVRPRQSAAPAGLAGAGLSAARRSRPTSRSSGSWCAMACRWIWPTRCLTTSPRLWLTWTGSRARCPRRAGRPPASITRASRAAPPLRGQAPER